MLLRLKEAKFDVKAERQGVFRRNITGCSFVILLSAKILRTLITASEEMLEGL
jgi:hypothetical protein